MSFGRILYGRLAVGRSQLATSGCFDVNEDRVIQLLAATRVYRDYQRAFTTATGLPLALQAAEDRQVPFRRHRNENSFCAMIAGQSSACGGCLQLQQKLLKRAARRACTFVCPFGMTETAVPVRSGAKLVGFLRTGQVFREKPNEGQFSRAAEKLRAAGFADTERLEEAYHATPVIESMRYQASLGLLTVFAGQLAGVSAEIAIQQSHAEPVVISRVKTYIREHHAEELPLRNVARAVNISPSYLCRIFKRATGMNYNQYRAHVRLENARKLLLNPNLRIGEIAYAAGFQSLTQFNRLFKNTVGQSPTEYRAARRVS